MNMTLDIYCIDPGSIPGGNFGWAGSDYNGREWPAKNIEGLAESITSSLKGGHKVALGVECPLFLPVRESPEALAVARSGEGGHPWSAGAGPYAMTTGLCQLLWTLGRVQARLDSAPPPAFLSWSHFCWAPAGLLLWEAFVVGAMKSQSHAGDALAAVRSFRRQLPSPRSRIAPEATFSLGGAALLAAGWSSNIALLREPCLVIEAQDSAASA